MKATQAGASTVPESARTLINGHCIVCKAGFQFPYGPHRVPESDELHTGTCTKDCEVKYNRKQADLRQAAEARFLASIHQLEPTEPEEV